LGATEDCVGGQVLVLAQLAQDQLGKFASLRRSNGSAHVAPQSCSSACVGTSGAFGHDRQALIGKQLLHVR
jgi:hypothetical protein